jgi:hypothetical protein
MHATATTTIWPGEYIEVDVPSDFPSADQWYAIEPRQSTSTVNSDNNHMWPIPEIVHSVSKKVQIPNLTSEPLTVKRHELFSQIRVVMSSESANSDNCQLNTEHCETSQTSQPPKTTALKNHLHSSTVQLDPHGVLPTKANKAFSDTLREFDKVFSPSLPGYNGKTGPFQTVVNMGPVSPPQRKGRIPQYSCNQLSELQEQFNLLEEQDVFKPPEDIEITVEYLNPSFLVKRPNRGYRLVTAFADVGRYKTTTFINAECRQYLASHSTVEVHHRNGFNEILLSNPTVLLVHEILWSRYPISRSTCVYKISYWDAVVRNRLGRIDVSSIW